MNANSKRITVDMTQPLSSEAQARLDALDAAPVNEEDIPAMPDAWLREAAGRRKPPQKKPVSIRLDEDIIEFFKTEDIHYQSRINAVLRTYVDAMRA